MSKVFYKALGKKEEWPDITGANPTSLTYDDVLLVPQISKIESRSDVDTTVKIGPYTISKPLMPSPMDTITGEKMARELGRLGAIGTIPRGDLKERLLICERLSADNVPCIYAVSLKNGFEEAKQLKERGAKVILLDVANGGMEKVVRTASEIKEKLGVHIMTGNIVTYEQAKLYKSYKIDYAKVGVGPGGMCITRLVAGAGFPQLSAIFETSSVDIPVIADGGIKKPADFAKAIAAGASMAMLGSLFAGYDETPGEVKNGKKSARGQASEAYMKDNGVETGEFRTAEGVSLEVYAKGPVGVLVNNLTGGLRSAMTYMGAKNIEEFQKKAEFALVSSSAKEEGTPWLSGMDK